MKKLLLVLAAIALMAFAAPSFAGSGSLNGTYVGTGSGSALFAFCGFNSTGFPIQASSGFYSTFLINTQGRWDFNPHGTGSLQIIMDVVTLANPVLPTIPGADALRFPWVGVRQGTVEFTYDFDPTSGKLDVLVNESHGEWTEGPLTGFPGSLQPPFSIGSGIVSQDRKSIKFDSTNKPATLDLKICPVDPNANAQIAEQLSSILLRQDRAPSLFQ